MTRTIYSCDCCGYETDLKNQIFNLNVTRGECVIYERMLCEECLCNVKDIIDLQFMAINPDDLRKGK